MRQSANVAKAGRSIDPHIIERPAIDAAIG
jgi:hypothetical protein